MNNVHHGGPFEGLRCRKDIVHGRQKVLRESITDPLSIHIRFVRVRRSFLRIIEAQLRINEQNGKQ